jgi:Rhs element Vgr protein
MAPPSPANVSDKTLRYTIKVNGSQIPDTYPVVSIDTHHEINKIPYAEIVLIDGTVEASDFPISEGNVFIPGNEIEISAGHGDEESAIFKGLIVKQGIKINSSGLNLIVTCKHAAVKMTFNKRESIFTGKKDSEIIKSLTGEYNLTTTVTATNVVHESIFQKLATDWDFLLSRTDFSGFIVSYDLNKMIIGKPIFNTAPVLRVSFGESVISFDAELSAERQAPSLEASAWDIDNKKSIISSAAEPSLNAQGNLNAKLLSAKLSQKKLSLNTGTPMDSAALKSWADSNLLRMRLSALKGKVKFIGSSLVKTGDIIELAGVGDRYNGKAFVSAVSHTLNDGDWLTTVKFGLDFRPISGLPDFSYTPAAGQLPAIHGLQIGIVKKISSDPKSGSRIKVVLSANASSEVEIWARLSNFYATSGAGSFFLPEIDDEVVVGFLDSNPAFPVILGSLYGPKNKAAYSANDDKNNIKAITTRSKMKIEFDDEKKITTIQTPGGNKIILDDDAKAINIIDQNSNSLKMTSSGIEMKSAKDIILKATGNITLDATGKLSLSSKQDVAIEGLNINNTAKVGFTAKGNASAEISASGQTVVKGAMVMIN